MFVQIGQRSLLLNIALVLSASAVLSCAPTDAPTEPSAVLSIASPTDGPQRVIAAASNQAFSVTYALQGAIPGDNVVIWRQQNGVRRFDILPASGIPTQGEFVVQTGFSATFIAPDQTIECLWLTAGDPGGGARISCGVGEAIGPVFGTLSNLDMAVVTGTEGSRSILGRPTSCYRMQSGRDSLVCADAAGIPLYVRSTDPSGNAVEMEAIAAGTPARITFPSHLASLGEFATVPINELQLPDNSRRGVDTPG